MIADFVLSARTMNFDGRRSSWVRKLTTVEAVGAEFDAWAERPDALYVEMLCEGIGWVLT